MRQISMCMMALCLVQPALSQQSPHGSIKTPCADCHGTDSWVMRSDATFDHSGTGFSLEGQHQAVPCVSCHSGLKFAGTMSQCSSCHTDAHAGELGNDCARCHSERSWSISDMRQRHAETRFPLLGAHAVSECSSCHTGTAGRRYRGLPVNCVSCHQEDYRATKNPGHTAAGFSTDCLQCHTVTAMSWGTGFDHAMTRFPLTGAHVSQQCVSCHVNNVFAGTSSACITCHQSSYTTAQNPNHAAAAFPTICQQCHSTAAWKPATFDHAVSSFPLTGAHLSVACTDCHVSNQYSNLATTCFSCHNEAFSQAVNPNHVAAQFSQECTQCHTTVAWTPATFDHASTSFPLSGAHLSTSCQQCHVGGNYQIVYSDCYQCHQDDFQAASTLNHVSLNFSHNCENCHTTTAWMPSTFDHDALYFRIYSGEHREKWSQCASCHPNASSYAEFTCISCHEHNKPDTDDDHREVQNYLYASPNCYSCHRNV